jgi:DNA repair protein RecO (recombination protein O)
VIQRESLAEPALLLRRHPYGESSLVLHLLTPARGRIALLAKGAYRPNSGYFAVFDFFDTLEVRGSIGPGQDLGLLRAARVRTRRADLARDLASYRVALGLVELAQATARESHGEHALFGWLEQWLDALLEGPGASGAVAVAAGLALLKSNGLAPAFLHCASCGARAQESAEALHFSIPRGGRLCRSCADQERARGGPVESLSLNVARIAASLMESTPTMLSRTHVEPNRTRTLVECVARLLEYHLEMPLRSSWTRLLP